MKKLLAIFAAAALLALALAGCGAPKPQDLLAGKWQASAAGFEISAFEFTPDEKDPWGARSTLAGSRGSSAAPTRSPPERRTPPTAWRSPTPC